MRHALGRLLDYLFPAIVERRRAKEAQAKQAAWEQYRDSRKPESGPATQVRPGIYVRDGEVIVTPEVNDDRE